MRNKTFLVRLDPTWRQIVKRLGLERNETIKQIVETALLKTYRNHIDRLNGGDTK